MNKDWLSFLFIYVIKLNQISLIGTIKNIETVSRYSRKMLPHINYSFQTINKLFSTPKNVFIAAWPKEVIQK